MTKGCYDYCAGRIRGILENKKLLGEISEDFDVEIKPLNKRFHFIPPNTYVMTCEHGRDFAVREIKK